MYNVYTVLVELTVLYSGHLPNLLGSLHCTVVSTSTNIYKKPFCLPLETRLRGFAGGQGPGSNPAGYGRYAIPLHSTRGCGGFVSLGSTLGPELSRTG